MNLCPLCESDQTKFFFEREDKHCGFRYYLKCPVCYLIFLRSDLRLDKEEEKRRYDMHENDPEDTHYQDFLNRLIKPLTPKLRSHFRGLDFGCGPGPAIGEMLKATVNTFNVYDPLYFPDTSLKEGSYDFITCTETVEHFFWPRKEFERMSGLLKDCGILGIMTDVLEDEDEFPQWHYPTDPTHVCFYQKETLEWVAAWQGWQIERPSKNVAIYTKGILG